MKKQIVVRTYPKGWTSTTENLQRLLDSGYLVVRVTPLENSITEYIVEKEREDE